MITVVEPHHRAAFIDAGLTDAVDAWVDPPSGGDEHRWATWQGGAITSAARVQLQKRLRARHAAEISVLGAPDAALLNTAVGFIDGWSPIERLFITAPAGSPWTAVLLEAGFEIESVRRQRLVATPTDPVDPTSEGDALFRGHDEHLFGRLRPGFVPRAPGPPPRWPPRTRREVRWTWRPATADDIDAIGALSVEPTVVWGTLQVASANRTFFAQRHEATPPGDRISVLIDEHTGELAGMGGMHVVGVDGVRLLGMALRAAWQGCGGGHAIMNHLLDDARQAGARRVELAVWEDNHRAIALYRSHGFEPEGRLRYDGLRAGGHACSLEMARTL